MNFADATSFRIYSGKLLLLHYPSQRAHLCEGNDVPRCDYDVSLPRHSSEFDTSRKLPLARIVGLGRRDAEARVAY